MGEIPFFRGLNNDYVRFYKIIVFKKFKPVLVVYEVVLEIFLNKLHVFYEITVVYIVP